MADDIEDSILSNAQAPKKVTGDQGSAEQHSIPDQIAAAKFKAANSGNARSGLPIRYVKFRPSGAHGVNRC